MFLSTFPTRFISLWLCDVELVEMFARRFGGFVKTLVQVISAKLTRRAKAYSSSCSQVILVYLQTFRRNSLFCSQKLPKITLN